MAAAFLGALFSVVQKTITASKGRKEDFDKAWAISDAALQPDATRTMNLRMVQTQAIDSLVAHTKEILKARELCAPAMEVDDTPGPTNAAPGMKDPTGELEFIFAHRRV